MAKTKQERIIEAEDCSSRYLADANEAAERDNKVLSEKLYEKSQFWRDRYNTLAGNV